VNTTTSTAAEAVITTLTAEVRTLVVGSRQVTLSVAKQLDTVPLENLTVMGRVRVGDYTHVIGTAKDGTLALARYNEQTRLDVGELMLRLEADDLPSRVKVCGGLYVDRFGNDGRSYSSNFHYFKFTAGTQQGRPILLNAKATESCRDLDHRQGRQSCDDAVNRSDLGELCRAELDRQHLEQCLTVERHRAAAAAPLIVLAGLK
jgi:hypothetical protein